MRKQILFILVGLTTYSVSAYAQTVITNKGDKIPAEDLKVEPWRIESTGNKATLNTEKIYQNGSVGIGNFTNSTILSSLHVKGNAYLTSGLSIAISPSNTLEPDETAWLNIGSIAGAGKGVARFSINNCGVGCGQTRVAPNIILNNYNSTSSQAGASESFGIISFVASGGAIPADKATAGYRELSAAQILGIDRDVTNNYGGLAIQTRSDNTGLQTRFSVHKDGRVDIKNVGATPDNTLTKILAVNNAGQIGHINKEDIGSSVEPLQVQGGTTKSTQNNEKVYLQKALGLGDFTAKTMTDAEKLRIENGELNLVSQGNDFADIHNEYYTSGLTNETTLAPMAQNGIFLRKARGTQQTPEALKPNDIISSIHFQGRNTTKWDNIGFSVNAYRGSTDNKIRASFSVPRLTPENGATRITSFDAMRITEDGVPQMSGAVGIGVDISTIATASLSDSNYPYMLVAKKDGSLGVAWRRDLNLIASQPATKEINGVSKITASSNNITLTADQLYERSIVVVPGGGKYILPRVSQTEGAANGKLYGKTVRFYVIGSDKDSDYLSQDFTIECPDLYFPTADELGVTLTGTNTINPNPELIESIDPSTKKITFKKSSKKFYRMITFYCTGYQWFIDCKD